MIHRLTDIDPFSVRVSVYRNLRTAGWSIKTAERVGDVLKGRVIAHADTCAIVDAVFEVNERMLAATTHANTLRLCPRLPVPATCRASSPTAMSCCLIRGGSCFTRSNGPTSTSWRPARRSPPPTACGSMSTGSGTHEHRCGEWSRPVRRGRGVCVYKNLRNGKWSITAVKGGDNGGLLLGHADEVQLTGVRFVVNESRQQAIAAGGHREVCAWVIGKLGDPVMPERLRRVTFRPREQATFFLADTGEEIRGAWRRHVRRVRQRLDLVLQMLLA